MNRVCLRSRRMMGVVAKLVRTIRQEVSKGFLFLPCPAHYELGVSQSLRRKFFISYVRQGGKTWPRLDSKPSCQFSDGVTFFVFECRQMLVRF